MRQTTKTNFRRDVYAMSAKKEQSQVLIVSRIDLKCRRHIQLTSCPPTTSLICQAARAGRQTDTSRRAETAPAFAKWPPRRVISKRVGVIDSAAKRQQGELSRNFSPAAAYFIYEHGRSLSRSGQRARPAAWPGPSVN